MRVKQREEDKLEAKEHKILTKIYGWIKVE